MGERSTDYKSYEDKQRLFDGGWEVITQEYLEKEWNDKMGDWNKQPKSKLPKWYGERPGKKGKDPETPEEEEAVEADEDILELDKDELQAEEEGEDGEEEYEDEEEEGEDEEE